MDYLAYLNYNRQVVNDYIAHHGVKGQKWGDRNYQYEDGSLTPEGKIHYGVGDGNSKQPQKAKPKTTPKKTTSSTTKTKAELEKELEEAKLREQKQKRNKKIAIAAGITATAVVALILGKKLHDKKMQNAELQKQADDGKKMIEQLSGENSVLKSDLSSASAKIEGLTRTRDFYKSQSLSKDKSIADLTSQTKAQKASIEGLTKTRDFYKNKSIGLEKDNSFLSTQNKSAMNTISQLKSEKKAAQIGAYNTGKKLEATQAYANVATQVCKSNPVAERTFTKYLRESGMLKAIIPGKK